MMSRLCTPASRRLCTPASRWYRDTYNGGDPRDGGDPHDDIYTIACLVDYLDDADDDEDSALVSAWDDFTAAVEAEMEADADDDARPWSRAYHDAHRALLTARDDRNDRLAAAARARLRQLGADDD